MHVADTEPSGVKCWTATPAALPRQSSNACFGGWPPGGPDWATDGHGDRASATMKRQVMVPGGLLLISSPIVIRSSKPASDLVSVVTVLLAEFDCEIVFLADDDAVCQNEHERNDETEHCQ